LPVWIMIAIRSLVALVFLFVLTRLNGKRQISQINIFEYMAAVTVGDIAAMISADVNEEFIPGAVSMIIWATIPIALAWLSLKSKWFRDLSEGRATIVVKNGKIMEDNLKKLRYSTDELLEQLRVKNAFNLADVEFALLEPSGDMSVLLKSENQPITPKQIAWQVAPQTESQTVIMDGNMMDEPLTTIGWNRERLQLELEKAGVTLNNVFLGQISSSGQLYIDLYDDQLTPPISKEGKLLFALLKKCQADLETFGLSTENPEGKRTYEKCASDIDTVVQSTKALLTR